MLNFVLILAALPVYIDAKLSCKNLEGEDVDWFVALKRPEAVDNSKGTSFVYFDSTKSGWVESEKRITSDASAIGATVSQLYSKDKMKKFYFTYNDECPGKSTDSYRGHSKGVIMFDQKQGFWMLHSVPEFPPLEKYSYPEAGTRFAQSFLCVTLDSNALHDLAKHLHVAHVNPCLQNLPNTIKLIAPELEDVVNKKKLGNKETTVMSEMKTLGKQKIKSFAKHKKYARDLWFDFVSVYLKTPMAVETWRNGAAVDFGSQCKYNKNNVYDITAVNTLNISYVSSKDHSKWGVSMEEKKPVVCIGDINRQESQNKRGGGAVCIENKKLWKTFYCSVAEYENCKNTAVPHQCKI